MQTPKPTEIYFLVLPDVHILDLAGPAQIFNHQSQLGKLQLHYISPESEVTSAQGLHLNSLSPLPKKLPPNSWVFIIGSNRDNQVYKGQAAEAAIAWLQQHDWNQNLLGGICSGAILLAQAGLLDNKRCTTHHQLINLLQKVSPHSQVLDNRLFVGDGSIWTSAGITTGIDLCLHLISRCWSDQATNEIARNMVLYLRRTGEDPQLSIRLQYRDHIHPKVHKAQDLLINDPSKQWSIKKLAEQIHLSERHLGRIFTEQTGITINAYLQKLRITIAQEMLNDPTQSLEQVAQKSGFGSDRQFRRLWKQTTGETPTASRAKNQNLLIN